MCQAPLICACMDPDVDTEFIVYWTLTGNLFLSLETVTGQSKRELLVVPNEPAGIVTPADAFLSHPGLPINWHARHMSISFSQRSKTAFE